MSVRLSMFAILLVAACASAPHPPDTTGKDPVERHVLALEAYADRACACTDRECAAALDEEIARNLAKPPELALYADPRGERAEQAMYRVVKCGWRVRHVMVGFEANALATMESMRRSACACETSACKVEFDLGRYTTFLRLIGVPVTQNGLETWKSGMDAINACQSRSLKDAP